MESLPLDVLRKIGEALAPCAHEHAQVRAWHDGVTAAAAAAACVIAGRVSREVGFATYRALLASCASDASGASDASDASVVPGGVTADSTVKQLRAALASWRLVRSGNKAEMWARLAAGHSPLCPVPRSLRHRGSLLRSRAPDEEYGCVGGVGRAGQHARIADVHAASLGRYGSLSGFEDARAERAKETAFFAVHCQPFYGQEVARYVREWDEEQDDYYDREGGGSYWRERERYRDGYDDEDEELEAVAKRAESEVKPQAFERWIAAYEGGPRRAAADACLPRALRQQLCTRLAEEELARWAAAAGVDALLDDLPPARGRQGEVRAFARGRLFAGRGVRAIRDATDLETACGRARLDEIGGEVLAWCARAREAHRRVSAAFGAAQAALADGADLLGPAVRHGPPATVSLEELYPSINGLLAADARLAGEGGAVQKDCAELIRKKKAHGRYVSQLLGDISDLSAGGSGEVRTCALCSGKRKFSAQGLRSHAAAKHGVR